jgi:hypothetical protein
MPINKIKYTRYGGASQGKRSKSSRSAWVNYHTERWGRVRAFALQTQGPEFKPHTIKNKLSK